jgi:hypothetical protein
MSEDLVETCADCANVGKPVCTKCKEVYIERGVRRTEYEPIQVEAGKDGEG